MPGKSEPDHNGSGAGPKPAVNRKPPIAVADRVPSFGRVAILILIRACARFHARRPGESASLCRPAPGGGEQRLDRLVRGRHRVRKSKRNRPPRRCLTTAGGPPVGRYVVDEPGWCRPAADSRHELASAGRSNDRHLPGPSRGSSCVKGNSFHHDLATIGSLPVAGPGLPGTRRCSTQGSGSPLCAGVRRQHADCARRISRHRAKKNSR